MKRAAGVNSAQKIAFAVLTAVYISSLFTSAWAMTKDELTAYSDNVKSVVEENMLQLKPGSLKNPPRTEVEMQKSIEEKHKRRMQLMKLIGGTNDTNWRDTLSYYSDLFKKCAERLSKEIVTRDAGLAGWHKKLIAGYQDSSEVTRLALGLLKTPDMTGLNQALADPELKKRIRDNQAYHQNLQAELDKLIRSYFPADNELQGLSQELSGLYVETTWK